MGFCTGLLQCKRLMTTTEATDGGKAGSMVRVGPGLFVLHWSTGFIGAKLGLTYADPLVFLLTRFVLVLMLLVPLAMAFRHPWPGDARRVAHIAVAGALLHGGYLGGVFSAIHQGMSAGVVALIVGLQPLLTALLGGFLLGEKVSARQWTGFLVGFLGVGLVVSDKLGLGGVTPVSAAVALLALLSITFGTLYQKRFCPSFDLWTG